LACREQGVYRPVTKVFLMIYMKSTMKLSNVFQNLILARAQEVAAPSHTGRPRVLSDSKVTSLLFKTLRTGCQWRELECGKASFMAVYRRLHQWERKSVIESAYQKALETYSKLRPPKRHLMDSSHVRNRHSWSWKPNTGIDRGRQGTKDSVVLRNPYTVTWRCVCEYCVRFVTRFHGRERVRFLAVAHAAARAGAPRPSVTPFLPGAQQHRCAVPTGPPSSPT
jgi:transposase